MLQANLIFFLPVVSIQYYDFKKDILKQELCHPQRKRFESKSENVPQLSKINNR